VNTERQAETLKVLGDATRLRLAALLAAKGEVCVCRLAEALGEPDFKVSRHLAVMRAAGLVEVDRHGVWKYYRLAKPATSFHAAVLSLLLACAKECEGIQADLARFDERRCGEDGPAQGGPAGRCKPVVAAGQGRAKG